MGAGGGAVAVAGAGDDRLHGLPGADGGEEDVEDAEPREGRDRRGTHRLSSSRIFAGTKSVSQPVSVIFQSVSSSSPCSFV